MDNFNYEIRITRIADREERRLKSVMNEEPQPYLTNVRDSCYLCYKTVHRTDIKFVEDPEGLFEDGVKVCKRCAEKLKLKELFNDKSASYHGLTEAILRIIGETWRLRKSQ